MASSSLFAAISLRVRDVFAAHARLIRCASVTYSLLARSVPKPFANRQNKAVSSQGLQYNAKTISPQWQFAVLLAPNFLWLDALLDKVTIPAWRKRIKDRIAKARALIGRLTSFRSGNNRPRVVRTARIAFAGTNISLSKPDITQKLTERIDDLKQKIAAWRRRIRGFTARSRRFNQNCLFQSDRKRLYKSLERPGVYGAGSGPDHADTVAFWRGLWSEPVNHSEGPWMEVVASQGASFTPMDPATITPEDVAEAIRRAPNWKSPELDGLHHYWLKGFVVCHTVLARQFQEALDQKSHI
ncbi:unnamed protein product [Parnassius apollo]|uniref:(apollo) hypothetical protein n=1 Tax=Parnassius apollo TaxID=110799 RepID=A0A8S3WDL0_PARAO|nr:unnamed protein product [Parnassius apollo]